MNITSRVLIVGRGVWDDRLGDTDTLVNIFHGAQYNNTAYIFIESSRPFSHCCRYFFQISEINLLKKLWHWSLKPFNIIDLCEDHIKLLPEKTIVQENATMNFVRAHRSPVFTWARELLWLMGGWKSKELVQFIKDFKPDKIFIMGSPLVLMNRLALFVIMKANVPASIFLMDDAYSYTYRDNHPLNHLYRWFQRTSIREVISHCQKIYVISPKMKEEYDKEFGVDSVFITKGVETHNSVAVIPKSSLISMVYMGQTIYGRLSTLRELACSIDLINKRNGRCSISLDIYSVNPFSSEQIDFFDSKAGVTIKEPVHASNVTETIAKYNVVVFVESFEKISSEIARLSFSTKLTDYLSSGKCIFAIGPDNIAPIEYLIQEDAAIVVTNVGLISDRIEMCLKESILNEYAKKAFSCFKKNHTRERIDELVYEGFLNKDIC